MWRAIRIIWWEMFGLILRLLAFPRMRESKGGQKSPFDCVNVWENRLRWYLMCDFLSCGEVWSDPMRGKFCSVCRPSRSRHFLSEVREQVSVLTTCRHIRTNSANKQTAWASLRPDIVSRCCRRSKYTEMFERRHDACLLSFFQVKFAWMQADARLRNHCFVSLHRM